ncbi:conserved hypothetical protein [Altererythrobacter sp. B11]|uniref:retropepsin-like aspartic protease family protein n=1 Tax=Altererythrobacter sp. B11 TaxID=2060312 RepID=UPI000DC6E8BB|nr:TIGR02281 family clan AA aspartic protease [Altererythrobacter sp. B11]BBC74426.1 conserved hypothetical protein [Altererythrobacter sp. B11]
MTGRPLILLICAAALAAWFYPGRPETMTAGEAPEKAVRASQMSGAEAGWMSGETVLPRAPDGHYYADVTVNGAESRMLVDTGASVIALTGNDAEAAGLTWNEADIHPVGRGVNGMVLGVPVTLDAVELGGLEADGVQAVIVPEGLDVSLLGQSFLSRAGSIEITDAGMALGG